MLLFDGRQRRPEFMGHHAYEIVLHVIQFFEVGDIVKHGDRAQNLVIRPGKGRRQGPQVHGVLGKLLGNKSPRIGLGVGQQGVDSILDCAVMQVVLQRPGLGRL
jgi:hypothetical protein